MFRSISVKESIFSKSLDWDLQTNPNSFTVMLIYLCCVNPISVNVITLYSMNCRKVFLCFQGL